MFVKIKNLLHNLILPTETLDESKSKWSSLAKENSNYYIYSACGRDISDSEFVNSGVSDYKDLVVNDRFLQKFLGPKKDKVALEIGCGTGRVTQAMAKDFKHVYGTDISAEMILQAKDKNKKNNITFLETDGSSFPLPDNSVDFVFSFIVFQHMPSKKVVRDNFSEIYRLLKSGGVAKIQVRGIPTEKGKWYYGVSFDKKSIQKVVLDLKILKTSGEGEKYFWLWLQK